jgi:hypothetical protein
MFDVDVGGLIYFPVNILVKITIRSGAYDLVNCQSKSRHDEATHRVLISQPERACNWLLAGDCHSPTTVPSRWAYPRYLRRYNRTTLEDFEGLDDDHMKPLQQGIHILKDT